MCLDDLAWFASAPTECPNRLSEPCKSCIAASQCPVNHYASECFLPVFRNGLTELYCCVWTGCLTFTGWVFWVAMIPRDLVDQRRCQSQVYSRSARASDGCDWSCAEHTDPSRGFENRTIHSWEVAGTIYGQPVFYLITQSFIWRHKFVWRFADAVILKLFKLVWRLILFTHRIRRRTEHWVWVWWSIDPDG